MVVKLPIAKRINPLHKVAAKTFYNYVFNNPDYFTSYKKLVLGLSDEQKKFIDLTIARALYLYTSQQETLFDFTPDEILEQEKVVDFLKVYKENEYYRLSNYKMSTNFFESGIFYYKFGVSSMKTSDKVKGKSVIDAGAFCGDSAIVLNEVFSPSVVYSFEPMQSAYSHLIKTISLNKLEDKIIPVKFGLGDKTCKQTIYTNGAASSVVSNDIFENSPKAEIEVTTIDDFVDKNNIEVGLIKIDVEGFDVEVLQGARKTITNQRPIIIGSIYHHAKQFFEFKPLLESWNLGYKFHFEKLNPEKLLNEINVTCEVY